MTSAHGDTIIECNKLREQIAFLVKEAKQELAVKDRRIAHLETECTRLFDPVKKFWNENLDNENKELKKALQWVLGTCDNAADLIDDDEEDETEEVRTMVKAYRKQFNIKKNVPL